MYFIDVASSCTSVPLRYLSFGPLRYVSRNENRTTWEVQHSRSTASKKKNGSKAKARQTNVSKVSDQEMAARKPPSQPPRDRSTTTTTTNTTKITTTHDHPSTVASTQPASAAHNHTIFFEKKEKIGKVVTCPVLDCAATAGGGLVCR